MFLKANMRHFSKDHLEFLPKADITHPLVVAAPKEALAL